jgi:hypothetical protein
MRLGEGMNECALVLRLDSPWGIAANHQANCAPAPPQALVGTASPSLNRFPSYTSFIKCGAFSARPESFYTPIDGTSRHELLHCKRRSRRRQNHRRAVNGSVQQRGPISGHANRLADAACS